MDTKDKMSRALGTAFLSHQVAQLEKNVNTGGGRGVGNRGRGGGAGGGPGNRGRGRGGITRTDVGVRRTDDDHAVSNPNDRSALKVTAGRPIPSPVLLTKSADRIVVDPSILIHSPGKFRAWCREGSRETVIVPLEALNTLDLLKKGTSPLAIRARNASRTLEAQVGVNPRIHVQQDHGYVPWEEVFHSRSQARNRLSSDSAVTDASSDDASDESFPRGEPPEWLKRTICCAKYEQNEATPGQRVVLAVCSTPEKESMDNRFENRATGYLTKRWASNVGLRVLDVDADDEAPSRHQARLSNEDTVRPPKSPKASRIDDGAVEALHLGDDATATHRRKVSAEAPIATKVWTPSSPKRPSFGQPNYRGRKGSGLGTIGGGNLVEKPSAPVQLTNAGRLPDGKVIRLLARGEKLEP